MQFAEETLQFALKIKKKRKKTRFEFGNRNCLKNSPLANCKRHPCNLQTTRLQFADGPLAICKRHAYILAIAPGEREAGVRVGGGWGRDNGGGRRHWSTSSTIYAVDAQITQVTELNPSCPLFVGAVSCPKVSRVTYVSYAPCVTYEPCRSVLALVVARYAPRTTRR